MSENCRKAALAAAQLWSWLVAAVFLAQIESFFSIKPSFKDRAGYPVKEAGWLDDGCSASSVSPFSH